MLSSYLLLIAAAFAAGIMNAVAGGGSFLTFPALIFTGVPSIIANASSTVALFPGSFASAWAYRHHFSQFDGIPFKAVLGVSLAGGLSGALLLLFTPQRTFDGLLPWLLLFATTVFTFGPKLAPKLRQWLHIGPFSVLVAQYVVSIYGGYFGGAVGIMMLAVWSLFGLEDIHTANASKTLLSGSMNAVAVVCFVIANKVWWPQTLAMLVAAVIGGYVGARMATRMNSKHVRLGISLISFVMTAVFFLRRS